MKHIDITAFISGICPPQRLQWLKQSVDHLDKQRFPFVKKIISVDEFRGDKMPQKLTKYFESKGWIVLVDAHMSRPKSMERALSIIDSEYTFYNEDDVKVTMPDISDVTRIFNVIEVHGRTCGMLSLTLGGSKWNLPGKKFGDLNCIQENTLLENHKYIAFRRLEETKNEWFFEFPVLFIRTDLFKRCHKTAIQKFRGSQVEMGLTKAWFKEKLDKKYYKCSLCKKSILNIYSSDKPAETFEKAKFITSLDPQQGASPISGSHTF